LGILTSAQLGKVRYFLFFITLTGCLEALGVASIFPFLTVLTDGGGNVIVRFLNSLYFDSSKVPSESIILILGGATLLLFLSSLAIRSLVSYKVMKFALQCEAETSTRLMQAYLSKTYEDFFGVNGIELGKTILSEVDTFVHSGLIPLISLVSYSIVCLFLLLVAVVIAPTSTIIVFAGFGLIYLFIYLSTRSFLRNIGLKRYSANDKRFKIISQTFECIKAIKFQKIESLHLQYYEREVFDYAKYRTWSWGINQLPRYLIEGAAFGILLVFIIYLRYHGENPSKILPELVLFAFVGYRVLPALQIIYASFSSIRFSSPTISRLAHDLKEFNANKTRYTYRQGIIFDRKMELQSISYRYPGSTHLALNNITIRINPRGLTGITGASGSGKTTFLDIFVGLIEPCHGLITLDGFPASLFNNKAWSDMLSYVPQTVYILDGSIAENITYGSDYPILNKQRMLFAARIAEIDQFVLNDCKDGFDTHIGERGSKISGGQRQRIGLARALYKSPRILVLDEATSALDSDTEMKIIDNLRSLSHQMLVILVTHRAEVLNKCDHTIYFSNGGLN
jgi:ABC-type bacteriocin/lantibiotic exporter with double-glycine peptidase domain